VPLPRHELTAILVGMSNDVDICSKQIKTLKEILP